MRDERKSERNGWILGWLGGFIWVLVLALVSTAKGEFLHGAVGIALFAGAAALIFLLSPWRYPMQPYWRLMSPLYLLFFISAAWLVWISGGLSALGFSAWSLFLLLPLLLPIYLAGRRRWIEGEHKDV